MIKYSRGVVAIIFGLLLVGIVGCGGPQDAPPQAIITQAVIQLAEGDQANLWQQLSLPDTQSPSLSVDQVKPQRVRPVQVASTIAYEVSGTYRYTIRYANRRRIQQSHVPFAVVLQSAPGSQDWQFLQLKSPDEGDRPWTWQPLMGDPA